jgi:2-polyprenyl-6-methoxyphenol hydroxylase-like FAD-dependent oxidoreductase
MNFTIGIAGCGVAGLTAAVRLARAGHRIVMHEQAPTLGPVGAGVLLQPSGQMVLRAMGLLDQVVPDAEPVERLKAYTHRGGRLIDLPYGELAGAGADGAAMAYGLQRGELFTVLHRTALAAGVHVRAGERIIRYRREKEGVYFEEAGGARHGPYDFVLAADGARSALRENGSLRARAMAYPHGAMWAIAPCAGVSGHLLQKCRGTQELCGVLPTGRGRASLFWSVRKNDVEALKQRGFPAWRARVVRLCPEAAELFDADGGIRGFESVQFVSYMHVHMPRPFDENCLFLGDAAHAMSPHLGQGINLALIDGYEFAAALAESGRFETACAAFVAGRAAHLRAYRIITYWLSPFFQSRGFIKGWGRDLALPLMPGIPPLRRQMVRTMAGCRGGLWGGTWKLRIAPAASAASAARTAHVRP